MTEGAGTARLGEHQEVGLFSGLRFWYPVATLADFRPRWRELEEAATPIGLVVLGHLASQDTQGRPWRRYESKLRLTRRILEAGHDRETVEQLYRFVDWLLRLPPEQAARYREERARMEEETVGRSYMTQCEELGQAEALEQGREQGLEQGLEQGREQGREQGCH